MKKYLSLLLLVAVVFSCKKENLKPGEPPTANAGNDQNAMVGSTVTLNGTGTDPDGDPLTFNWAITTAPSGSTASISNPTSQTASFVPDVAGTYTVTFSVNDGVHQSVTDEAIITVTESEAEKVEIDSDINENTLLEDIFEDPDMADYLVTRDVDVNAELTIEPGVVIEFQQDKLLKITGTGMINAEGTMENPIVFTSSNIPGQIRWAGVVIESSDARNSISYVVIDWAGSEANIYSNGWKTAALGVADESKVKLNNIRISHSGDYGLFVHQNGELSEFSNNSFQDNEGFPIGLHAMQVGSMDGSSTLSGNRKDIVEIHKSTLESNDEIQWNALNNARYHLTGDLTIKALLRIAAGTQFELAEEVGITVKPEGVIVAKGSANNEILFTTANETGQAHWSGIIIESSDVRNEIDYAKISWAAAKGNFYYNGWKNVSVGVDDDAKLTITNSTISKSKADGLYLHSGAGITMANLNFEDNQGYPAVMSVNHAVEVNEGFQFSNNSDNAIAIYRSEFTNNQKNTLVALVGNAYYLVMNKTDITQPLNIDAGASIKFTDGGSLMVKESGGLNAVGTGNNMITFTAYNPSQKWDGITIETNHNNQLNYCEISFGGNEAIFYSNGWKKINVAVDGRLEMENSVVTNSGGIGLYISNSSVVNGLDSSDPDLESTLLSENSFSNNAESDITIQ